MLAGLKGFCWLAVMLCCVQFCSSCGHNLFSFSHEWIKDNIVLFSFQIEKLT